MRLTTRTSFLLSTSLFPHSSFAVLNNCLDCGLDCSSWTDAFCHIKWMGCRVGTVPYELFTGITELLCRLERPTNEDYQLIETAKGELIATGYFTRQELDAVNFSFCPFTNGGGLSPSEERVYFNVAVREASLPDRTLVMAHKMEHVRQFQRLSHHVFACEYSGEIIRGNGWMEGNWLEDEAYAFEASVRLCLVDGTGCP